MGAWKDWELARIEGGMSRAAINTEADRIRHTPLDPTYRRQEAPMTTRTPHRTMTIDYTLARFTIAEARSRAAHGAAELDRRAATTPQLAGWREQIDLDLLDLRSCCRCVLGQLAPLVQDPESIPDMKFDDAIDFLRELDDGDRFVAEYFDWLAHNPDTRLIDGDLLFTNEEAELCGFTSSYCRDGANRAAVHEAEYALLEQAWRELLTEPTIEIVGYDTAAEFDAALTAWADGTCPNGHHNGDYICTPTCFGLATFGDPLTTTS